LKKVKVEGFKVFKLVKVLTMNYCKKIKPRNVNRTFKLDKQMNTYNSEFEENKTP